ncbi:MAG: hypothetical protein RMM53_03605 [Bacteroidia bacterium]|nr:hypothetical protein [Bacteroidia bacterium]MDW8333282.1 hypothetical protein [Bacteroidia bacterium]
MILEIGSRVEHPKYGPGAVIDVRSDAYVVTFVEHGTKVIAADFPDLKIVEAAPPYRDRVSFYDMEKALTALLRRWSGVTELIPIADKWRGGTMIIRPANPNLKPKEIPNDVFFHKIVMIREKLRVLEQKINNSPQLSDDERVEWQQYITRIYGTLTTFNELFAEKSDHFVGQRGKD